MAGPDQEGTRAQLEQLAQRLGITDRIYWPGPLFGDAKWSAFCAADAFVLPSHQENFGIAVVEAMSCGTPVLISNKVNIWREIEQDGAGLTADDTVSAFADLLGRWIKMSNEDRKTIGDTGRKCFIERFEIGRAAQNLIDVLSAR